MGKQSRAKRERREQASFVAGLTACEGTWLERAPDSAEVTRIQGALQLLRNHRLEAQALAGDRDAFNAFSLQIYREERWSALHFEDWLIEAILDEVGEPPIVMDNNDPAFSNYLLRALGVIASARVRRVLAEQSRRFVPQYVGEGRVREALAIEHNAYMTVMSDAATPLLVQMLVGGLARWYDEHEEEGEAEAEAEGA
jgi:hypothetical protein